MIILGRIGAPFGVHGGVRVRAFGDDPVAWRKMPKWWLGKESDWRAYDLRAFSPCGSDLIAQFAGITDRDAALAIRGLYIAAPRELLPAPG
ncbi:MAG TPA: hypothetical protein VN277_02265, partial [Acidiferrobacterales bacterium]|nr:hypothetical protein [Acidiferrobacterales bacterium]